MKIIFFEYKGATYEVEIDNEGNTIEVDFTGPLGSYYLDQDNDDETEFTNALDKYIESLGV